MLRALVGPTRHMGQLMPVNTFVHGSVAFRDRLRHHLAARRNQPDELVTHWYQGLQDGLNQLQDALADVMDGLVLARLHALQEANREMLLAACSLDAPRFEAAVTAQQCVLDRVFAYLQSPEDCERPPAPRRRRSLSPLEEAAWQLREERLPDGRPRTFGQIALDLNRQGFTKRGGEPHDYQSAKAAYHRAADKQ
jgi:hypothetical protein